MDIHIASVFLFAVYAYAGWTMADKGMQDLQKLGLSLRISAGVMTLVFSTVILISVLD